MSFSREAASLYVKEVYEKCGSVEAGLWQLQKSVKQSLGQNRGGDKLVCKGSSSSTEFFPNVFSISATNGSEELQRWAREGRLVRCCGMIQDVQSDLTVMSGTPESFLSDLPDSGSGAACSGVEGKKKESLRLEGSRRDTCCHVETAVLRVIPVPGNTWFYEDKFRVPQEEKGERSSSGKEMQQSFQIEEEKGAAVGQESRQEYSRKVHFTSTNDDPVLNRTMELAMNLPQPIFHPKLCASCMVTVLAPRYQNRGIEKESLACEGKVNDNSSSFDEADDAFVLDVSPFQINDVYEFYGYLEVDEEDPKKWETKTSGCGHDGNVKRKKKWEDEKKREKNASDEDHEWSESSERGEKVGIRSFSENDGDFSVAWHPTKSYRQAGAHVTHLLSVAATLISSANTFGLPLRIVEEKEGKENVSGDASFSSHSSHASSESYPRKQSHPTTENDSENQCDCSTLTSSPSSEWFEEGRASSIRFLSRHICHGDALVAEYLLLHLCSHVLAHASATPLGDVPLLIRYPSSLLSGKTGKKENINEEELEEREQEDGATVLRCWVEALRFLVPVAVVAIDKDALQLAAGSSRPPVQSGKKRTDAERTTLKVEKCAARQLAPQYESSGSYLCAGSLQLANGTNLVVDCTGLLSGGNASASSSSGGLLEEKSCIYDILFSLVHQCRLPIDYPYYRVELPVSLSVLAIASEREALPEMLAFPLSILLHVDPTVCSSDTSIVEAGEKAEEDNFCEKTACPSPQNFGPADVRSYIAAVRRQTTINFSLRKQYFTPAVMEALADSFSQLGKEFDSWNNHQSLIHNNIFSVATSLVGVEVASRGRIGATQQDIHYFVGLERKRMDSLRSFNRVNNV